jgi:hypothetical protein
MKIPILHLTICWILYSKIEDCKITIFILIRAICKIIYQYWFVLITNN